MSGKVLALVIVLLIFLSYACCNLYVKREVRKKQNTETPEWLSGLPLEIFEKKVNRKIYFSDTFVMFCSILSPKFKNKMTWEMFEDILAPGIDIAKRYNYIVGIASGGAIVAQFLSYHSGIPFGCIKVHHYGEKSFLGKSASVIDKGELNVEIIEELPDLSGKRVLLVDDFSLTGKTLEYGKKYVEEQGANCDTLIIGGRTCSADYSMGDVYYSGTPWGYDA